MVYGGESIQWGLHSGRTEKFVLLKKPRFILGWT